MPDATKREKADIVVDTGKSLEDGIESIASQNLEYKASTFESFNEVPSGYYALQQGRVEANDFRDVLSRAEELSQLIRKNNSLLQQVAGRNTQTALQQLDSGCKELEEVFDQLPTITSEPGYYLHLKAADPQDMIYVRFWLTQGAAAEGVLSAGDLLVAERDGDFEGGGAWVV